MTRGIVYYSDNRLDPLIAGASQRTIEASGMPIVAVTLKPIAWKAARNIVLEAERSVLTMFRQILAGLEASTADVVFFCEHDCLYPRDQWSIPYEGHLIYNEHVWKVDAKTGKALHYRAAQTSGLCGSRRVLIEHYRRRVEVVERSGFSQAIGFEPGTHNRPERIDNLQSEVWMSKTPIVDIRHAHNLTPSRWRKEQFRNQRFTEGWTEADAVPGWGVTKGRMREFLESVARREAVA